VPRKIRELKKRNLSPSVLHRTTISPFYFAEGAYVRTSSRRRPGWDENSRRVDYLEGANEASVSFIEIASQPIVVSQIEWIDETIGRVNR
jgi:hypothetical protein